jgi:hypothetical protein
MHGLLAVICFFYLVLFFLLCFSRSTSTGFWRYWYTTDLPGAAITGPISKARRRGYGRGGGGGAGSGG